MGSTRRVPPVHRRQPLRHNRLCGSAAAASSQPSLALQHGHSAVGILRLRSCRLHIRRTHKTLPPVRQRLRRTRPAPPHPRRHPGRQRRPHPRAGNQRQLIAGTRHALGHHRPDRRRPPRRTCRHGSGHQTTARTHSSADQPCRHTLPSRRHQRCPRGLQPRHRIRPHEHHRAL